MALHFQPLPACPGSDAAQQVARLRHVLRVIEEMAGRTAASTAGDDTARIGSAYAAAPLVVRRRFDALVSETAAWATQGVNLLVAASSASGHPRGAAERLAQDLKGALRTLDRTLA